MGSHRAGAAGTGSLERAEEIFRKEFMAQPQWLSDRCLFVVDCNQNKVAVVISLWIGTLVDKTCNRVHWIATKEEYQGLGLIKAALTYVMDLYHKLEQTGYIYLTTQTYSYKAINIYKKFGFKQYLGNCIRLIRISTGRSTSLHGVS